MGLEPGTRLGAFEIIAAIGKGGMGEVYRARDSKLGRDVAIKVLPEDFAMDSKRVARFEREARVLASLNHSNISALHDFHHEQGVYFLVLELVEGDTLADRIDRGPLLVKETLPLFIQIAEALEAAHENGIIHRDLKPANIKIASGEKVKVLDFGMAKTVDAAGPVSPTDTTRLSDPVKLTSAGTILGTPTYMSPEQARGQELDKRSDVWAFGCCLYESLTGAPPFQGKTVVDTYNAILERQPNWETLPANAPESLRNLLRRCLEKEPRRRFSSAGDIALQLEESLRTLEARTLGGEQGAFDELLAWRPEAGELIPGREHWVLESKLGEGGFGEVWLAAHDKTKTKRVFKFCFDPDRVKGLRREVVLLRLLKESLGDREDIAHVLEWEFDRPPYFLEAEHTEGGDLMDWAEDQGGLDKVPLDTRLELVAQAAVALGAAHSVGVLHKDIKPANMLITGSTEHGTLRIRLSDFGIGQITDPGALAARGITAVGLTETLVAGSSTPSSGGGTRMYMAPELIEGKPSTTLCDMYSLGVVLYQMVRGDFSHTVSPGWEREVDDEILREDIAACVDGNPEHRLASASELAQRLRTLEERRAIRDTERRTREIAAKAKRRRRQFAIASTIGISLTILTAGIAIREFGRAEEQTASRIEAERARFEAEAARNDADLAREETARALLDAEDTLYFASVRLASSRIAEERFEDAHAALLEAPERLRNWEWGFLLREAHPELRRAISRAREDPGPDATTAEVWRDAVGHEVVSMLGHTSAVLMASFDSTGERVVTIAFDDTAMIWDANTGELLRTLSGNEGILTSVRFSPDGSQVATGSLSGVVKVWDVETGDEVWSQSGHAGSVASVIFSPDNTLLATASRRAAKVWEAKSGDEVAIFDAHVGGITYAQFTRDGQQVVTAASGGIVKTWDVRTGREVSSISGPQPDETVAISLSHDLSLAASISGDGDLMFWDPNTGRPGKTVSARIVTSLLANAEGFSADETCYIAAGKNGEIVLVDIAAAEKTVLISPETDSWSYLSFDPSGRRIVAGGVNGSVVILAAGERGKSEDVDFLVGHTDIVTKAEFSPDGNSLVTISYDKTGRVWDPDTGREVARLRGHDSELFILEYSRDGSRILTLSWDGVVKIWDGRTYEELRSIEPDGNLRFSQAVSDPRTELILFALATAARLMSPDGKFLIAPGEGAISNNVWDLDSGRELYALEGHKTPMYSSAISVESSKIVTSSADGFTKVWDLQTGSELLELTGHKGYLSTLFFNKAGTRILAGCLDSKARVWDVETGEILLTLTGHKSGIFGAKYSPDERLIITGSADATAILWDAATGEKLASLTGHGGLVTDVAFNRSGTRVLTTCVDSTVRVWDLTGRELATLPVQGVLTRAAWSPDGSMIVTCARDGSVKLWKAMLWDDLVQLGEEDASLDDRVRLWHETRGTR